MWNMYMYKILSIGVSETLEAETERALLTDMFLPCECNM